MSNLNDLKYRDRQVYAASLEDAHNKGYFSNSITREELMDMVCRENPQLRWHSTATHTGLFDANKKRSFICSIGKQLTIPQFTIFRWDTKFNKTLNRANRYGEIMSTETFNTDDDRNKVLMRSWRSILETIKKKGYKVDDNELV